MPHFYFHVVGSDGCHMDPVGDVYDTADDAMLEAVVVINGLFRCGSLVESQVDGWNIHVTDVTGTVHWIVPLASNRKAARTARAAAHSARSGGVRARMTLN